ncbi:hypothetical protein EYV94_15205 [Puteibacter caeruleilacunae]|nr:hypothetical protein EYV94_15205 [Puteibacter caeruleilacunae]
MKRLFFIIAIGIFAMATVTAQNADAVKKYEAAATKASKEAAVTAEKATMAAEKAEMAAKDEKKVTLREFHPTSENANKLVVLWTSGEADVAHRMVFMYTHYAQQQKMWDEITLIIWGPSSRLLAGDVSLQKKVLAMKKDGVIVKACIVCADMYGVSDKFREMGFEVKGMGQPLTNYIKQGYRVLTF